MKSLTDRILEACQGLPEGEVLTSTLILHLGSRSAVQRCLARMAQRNQLIRVSPGLYVVPVISRFGVRPPAASKVVRSLAALENEVIVMSGAAAANAMGLTTQVPVREIYVTSGRSRTLHLGKRRVQIRHEPLWLLSLGGCKAGDAVRAIHWMGEAFAGKAVAKVRILLSNVEWLELLSTRADLPAWMAKAIEAESNHASAGSRDAFSHKKSPP